MRLDDQAALVQTVVAGDPSYAGPLAGVRWGALMEMSLDRDAILAGLRETRHAAATM